MRKISFKPIKFYFIGAFVSPFLKAIKNKSPFVSNSGGPRFDSLVSCSNHFYYNKFGPCNTLVFLNFFKSSIKKSRIVENYKKKYNEKKYNEKKYNKKKI